MAAKEWLNDFAPKCSNVWTKTSIFRGLYMPLISLPVKSIKHNKSIRQIELTIVVSEGVGEISEYIHCLFRTAFRADDLFQLLSRHFAREFLCRKNVVMATHHHDNPYLIPRLQICISVWERRAGEVRKRPAQFQSVACGRRDACISGIPHAQSTGEGCPDRSPRQPGTSHPRTSAAGSCSDGTRTSWLGWKMRGYAVVIQACL